MKKLVVISAVIFNCLLYAETGRAQLEQFDFFLRPFKRGVEICREKGFTHFLVKEIVYDDERGQSLVFKGISDIEGDALISEIITEKFVPPVGTITLRCELLFFKSDPLAIESNKYQSYSANGIQELLIPKNQKKSVQKTQPWEESMELVKAASFTDDPEVLDQLTQFAAVLMLPFRTILPRALRYNSKYFLIKKIAFEDKRGQSLVFKGIGDVEGGVLISDNQIEEYKSPIGTINVESEIFFFENLPDEPLVVDLWDWLGKEKNSPLK